jgi:hypothetical protein
VTVATLQVTYRGLICCHVLFMLVVQHLLTLAVACHVCLLQIQPVQTMASAAAAATSIPTQQQLHAAASSSSSWQQQQQQLEHAPAAAAAQLHAVFEYEPPDRLEAPLPVARKPKSRANSTGQDAQAIAPHAYDSHASVTAVRHSSTSDDTLLSTGSIAGGGNSDSSSSSSSAARQRRSLLQPAAAAAAAADVIPQVDVLVVVTPAAAASGGGFEAVTAAAALAIAKANKAYIDSDIGVRLDLKSVRQVRGAL